MSVALKEILTRRGSFGVDFDLFPLRPIGTEALTASIFYLPFSAPVALKGILTRRGSFGVDFDLFPLRPIGTEALTASIFYLPFSAPVALKMVGAVGLEPTILRL